MVTIVDIRKYAIRCSIEKLAFWDQWYKCEEGVCVCVDSGYESSICCRMTQGNLAGAGLGQN